MQVESEYFLVIGLRSDAVNSKFKTSNIEYVGKSLVSGEPNWREITRLALSERCLGIVGTVGQSFYERIVVPDATAKKVTLGSMFDQSTIDGLLSAISAKPHLLLVHEAVLGGVAIYEGQETSPEEDVNGDEWDEWSEKRARDYFGDIDEDVRVRANARITAAGITTTPYKSNAEASMLSLAFIEDQHSNLLFRLYIPAGRLYENESEEMLRLFHDWLTTVRGKHIRQSGYKTLRGRVIEFFAESRSEAAELQGEMRRFNAFLSVVENPSAAADLLTGLGLPAERAGSIVSTYARRTRRLQLDVKYEWEKRNVEIRRELESELVDEAPLQSAELLSDVVDMLLPKQPRMIQPPAINALPTSPSVIINQQFITHAEGIVAQNIAGDAIMGEEARELEKLIALHASSEEQGELLNSLRELLDHSAPPTGRLKAKQRLKGFLFAAGRTLGGVGGNVLQAWIEKQMGL